MFTKQIELIFVISPELKKILYLYEVAVCCINLELPFLMKKTYFRSIIQKSFTQNTISIDFADICCIVSPV